MGLGPPATFPALQRAVLQTLQVNLGYTCNQACSHCHVDAGPWRREQMDGETIALIPEVLRAQQLHTLDLTGGAPELHPQFRSLVQKARSMGIEVIDRCNLTILLEEGQQDLAPFLATQGVIILASLPCYEAENVDRQRGNGVFAKSLEGLRRLNQEGYGREGSGLELHLVFNPLGPTMPPAQQGLQKAYKAELAKQGVVFNELKVMSNMPIQRFADQLARDGSLEAYKELLRNHHVAENLEHVMCRTMISVDWQGRLYDCDFNQMLGLASPLGGHLRDLIGADVTTAPIRVADHCFGCTAGNGSSCGGALRVTP
ncbi:MAG: arsenosugar biosynthesis radical SAM (seleno)protein ArsS [Cyanobacteriota bacterium]|nr:arsenosugar biosynthesis radical SAM (seleno)protein ArsS [Cyanobacteriota bacterium]